MFLVNGVLKMIGLGVGCSALEMEKQISSLGLSFDAGEYLDIDGEGFPPGPSTHAPSRVVHR